jgi:hypothetical protein
MVMPLGKRKFDDPVMRDRFLENVQLMGYDALAAKSVGCCLKTIIDWAAEDGEDRKEFKGLWELAKILHSQEIAHKLQQEALHGHEETIYDKDGKPVGVKRKYETPLRALMLRRHDEAFREKIDVNHGLQSGVMVMPQPVQSVKEWADLVLNAKREASEKGKEP